MVDIGLKFKPTTGMVNVGECFVCNCGIPLAKCLEDGYELLKYYSGKQIKIKITYDSMIRVKCGVCGRGFAVINLQEKIEIKDSISIVNSKC